MVVKKTFESCLWEELEQVLNLQQVASFGQLNALLSVKSKPLTDIETAMLSKLNRLLVKNFMDWNEDELKMQFISPLLYLTDYSDNAKYHAFSQRPLKMQTDTIELSGIVDWMLASGKQIPKEPFFFLHEYKKEKGTDNDPLGQLLAAMITAQFLNSNKDRTIYGAYIVGKDWYFVALQGQQYSVSFPYNTLDFTMLIQVYQILQHVKVLA